MQFFRSVRSFLIAVVIVAATFIAARAGDRQVQPDLTRGDRSTNPRLT